MPATDFPVLENQSINNKDKKGKYPISSGTGVYNEEDDKRNKRKDMGVHSET